VAEFDQMHAVLIRYPFGIPYSLIKEMAEDIEVITIVANASDEQTVLQQYENNNVNTENCSFLYALTDSYWTRDYGPWYVFDGTNDPGIVNFPYNRPRPNDNDIPIHMADYLGIDLYGMNIYHTGGNYMTDGMDLSSSTDLVYQENPTLSAEDIDSITHAYLGLDDYFVLPDPLGEPIQHIDCWGKFLSPTKVLIGQVPVTDPRYDDFEYVADYYADQTSSYGVPYDVIRVYTPGGPPATPYTNSLILNNKVYVPITGSQWDDEALAVYEEAMPGYEIYGFMPGGAPWLNTDAIHCRTKGVADIGMLYIDHVPLLGNVAFEENFEITASFITCSDQDLYPDSVLIKYRISDGPWNTASMEQVYGPVYSGEITGVTPMAQVSYYLYAADESGRNAKHPFIGEPDPHQFKAIGFDQTELRFNPDTVLFLQPEQMVEGIPLAVINKTSKSVTISELTEEGIHFPWYVEEMPELPYELEALDTLWLNVMCDLPVYMSGELWSDTMYVETLKDTYDALLMIDSDLISAVFEPEDPTDLKVYPNPFTEHVNFEFNMKHAGNVDLSIYDLNGRLIYSTTDFFTSGNHTIRWNGSNSNGFQVTAGYFFYKLKTDDNTESGKVILSK
jgi:agmatine/peptidylarginine deiminase